MKISELPQASAVTGEDIAVIVQDGVTKQVPRSVLVPEASDNALRTLAEGLSQATTIAQIRTAAQQFLDETEGTA